MNIPYLPYDIPILYLLAALGLILFVWLLLR